VPRPKVAIVATHPIQYYAPWFAYLAENLDVDVRVFYLWDAGVAGRTDPGFGVPIVWDLPLLDGYAHEFVPNRSPFPGTDRFAGLLNPGLARRLLQFRPQAVLLTTYNNASIAQLLLQWRGRGEPLLFRGDSHRLVPRSGIAAGVKRRVVARVFRRFAAALYAGAANKEYFRLHGVPPEKQFYSPHAVDNRRFFAARDAAKTQARGLRREMGIPENYRVILFAGKFEAQKRPLDLLQAFQRMRPERAALLFVGEGALEPKIRSQAAAGPPVYVVPFQNQSLMPRAYAAADLLVLPSQSETWGLVVNEAMCLGLPAIVSSHVGCAYDLVVPDETGLVFPAGDVAALGEAITSALSDDARLRAWGENASRKVRQFGYRQATDGLVAALQSLGIAANWNSPQPP